MFLCLDIGNTHICGGVFNGGELLFQFRHETAHIGTSDQFGIFIRGVLRENDINYQDLTKVGIASVVPSAEYSVRSACIKYCKLHPIFIKPGIKTGISLKIHNPNELGADLIAGAVAGKLLYPNRDILIFDLGTATTATFVNALGDFEGVSIAPGFRLMMESLQKNTARLFEVDIVRPTMIMGKNTKSSIQTGLYYTQLGLIHELIINVTEQYQLNSKPFVIGTGGFSQLFVQEAIFGAVISELVLLGIKYILVLN